MFNRAKSQLLLGLCLMPLALSGCKITSSSSGGLGLDEDEDDDDTTPLPTTPATPTYSVSGTLYATAGLTVDSDINDIYADYTSNDDPASPQVINNLTTVQGFASESGTGGTVGGTPALERFAYTADEDDYFSVTLQAGQTVQLQVVDYAGDGIYTYKGDLDLYLIDTANPSAYADVSATYDQFESVTAPADGTYLINVYADTGTSKYVLQVLDASASASVSHDDFVPNQILLRTEDSTSTVQAASTAGLRVASSKTTTNGPTLLNIDRSANTINTASSAASALATAVKTPALKAFNQVLWEKRQTLIDIKTLNQQKGIAYAEPNYIRKAQATPTDPYYSGYQWHYRTINLPATWDLATGTDVIVAVVDTGVFLTHEDLSSQLVAGYDFIADSSSARDGDGIDSNPDDPGDSSIANQSSWHGTHVAGTIAAATNNSKGGAGVAYGAKIMPIRVLGQDGGTTYDIIQGVRWAAGLSNDSGTVASTPADIINLSLGGSSSSQAEQDAFDAVMAAGSIVVAAAGNEGTSQLFYPASYDGVISVSATGYDGTLAYYSNYGTAIDVAAPGGNLPQDANNDGLGDGIMSTYVDVNSSGVRQSSYTYQMQGTSMATPHVAGVLALMKSAHSSLTSAQFTSLLQSCKITNKVNDSSCSRDNQYGYGQIDAYLAVTEAMALANGGSLPALPVSLQADPDSLNFGTTSTSMSFTISNGGGGTADVSGGSITDSADWLTLTAQSVDSEGLGTYLASIDRSSLSDGFHSATITVTDAAGSTAVVDVYVQEGVTSASEMTAQYVLLERANCNLSDCIYSSILANTNGTYSFSNIPDGEYYVLAGSDIDVDGYLCQTAETCGAYPSIGGMQSVTVSGGSVTGVDFIVTLNSGYISTAMALPKPAVEDTTESKSTKQIAE